MIAALLRTMGTAALLALAASAAAAAAQETADPSAATIEAIRALEAEAVAAANARDLDRVAALYASDAVIVSAGEQTIEGRAAFRAHLEPLRSVPLVEVEKSPDRIEAAASGDMAIVQGRYRNRYGDPAANRVATASGIYVAIYRRQPDGRWRIAVDVTVPDASEDARR